jgi:hypothetical protein
MLITSRSSHSRCVESWSSTSTCKPTSSAADVDLLKLAGIENLSDQEDSVGAVGLGLERVIRIEEKVLAKERESDGAP